MQAVSSVVGIGGMAGSVAGMFFAQIVSRILDFTQNNYLVPFALAAAVYLVALGFIHLLLPRLEPIRLPGRTGDAFLTGQSAVDSVSSGDAL